MKIECLRILLLIIMIIKPVLNDRCSFDDAYRDNQFYIVTNFDSLKKLNFNCTTRINMSMWGLKPSKKLILDNTLNLKDLKIKPSSAFRFLFDNFEGFDLDLNSFNEIQFVPQVKIKIWTLSNSNFNFFKKGMCVDSKCDESILNDRLQQNLFNGIVLFLGFKMKYSTNTCPLIFTNLWNPTLIVTQLSSTFIETNLLKFQNVSKDILKKLNCSIFQFQVSFYHTQLDSALLNEYIFKNMMVLDLNGQITSIQEDLFKPFKYLQMLRFRMQNIENVLVRNNAWLRYVNNRVNVDLTNEEDIFKNKRNHVILVIYQIFYNQTFYNYPEKDFCYFRNFPHNQMIWPKLRPSYKTDCSCTELFLIQYSALHSNSIDEYLSVIPNQYYLSQYYQEIRNEKTFTHCLNSSFSETIKMCDFNKRLDLCQIQTVNTKNNENSKELFYMNDWRTLSEYSHSILSLYINTVFSIISMIFNIFVIIIISDGKISKDSNKMYLFLKINSYLNIFYVLIRLLKLVDTCSNVAISEDIFCDTIYSKSKTIQYIKIIFIQIIGNSFQSAANITHITYTLSRYLTVSNNKSPLLTIIHRISLKKYLVFIILFSLSINLYVFWEFSIYNFTLSTFQMKNLIDTDIHEVIENRQDSIHDYKENYKTKTEYLILNILQYLKIIFSDLFYIVISFTIDFVLLTFVKNKISKNKELTKELRIPTDQENSKVKRLNSLKNRLTMIIIFSGINFILCRLPLGILSFYGFYFRNENNAYKPNLNMYLICRYYGFCISLGDFFYFFYLNSFIIQFFIFYKLDNNFKKSVYNIKESLKSKIRIIRQN